MNHLFVLHTLLILCSAPSFASLYRKGVLIDLGANCGNSYMLFKQKLESRPERFEYYLFEPNPYLIDGYLRQLEETERHVTIIPSAAWIEDGSISFYLDSNESKKSCDPNSNKNPQGASSIYKDEHHPRSGNRISVTTIDVNNWMLHHVNMFDYCILKVDIEGAEYELLRHLMAGGALALVDELYVEFHPPYTHKASLEWLAEAYSFKVIKDWH